LKISSRCRHDWGVLGQSTLGCHRPWGPCRRCLSTVDLYAVFPRLRLVFCSNRKTAAEWSRNYFSAVWAVHDRLDEATARYPLDSVEAAGPGREV
jgi:hypothetical protein